MSRSYLHTPIMGMTCAESEKEDKRLANRRHRRGENQRLHAKPDQFCPSSIRAYSDVWCFEKDGKRLMHLPAEARFLRK